MLSSQYIHVEHFIIFEVYRISGYLRFMFCPWIPPLNRVLNLRDLIFHEIQVILNLPDLQKTVSKNFTRMHFSQLWYSHEHNRKWMHTEKTWYKVFKFELWTQQYKDCIMHKYSFIYTR